MRWTRTKVAASDKGGAPEELELVTELRVTRGLLIEVGSAGSTRSVFVGVDERHLHAVTSKIVKQPQ